MIGAHEFIDIASSRSFGPWFSVPCSYLKPLINAGISSPDIRHYASNNEGEAVAMAVGAHLAGARPVVMFQNSGLGNAVNPLTSLVHTFAVPLLLIVTWRGQPGGKDAPQHRFMGPITPDMLDLLGIGSELFPDEPAAVDAAVERAVEHQHATSLPYAFLMKKGTIAPCTLEPPESPSLQRGCLVGLSSGSGNGLLLRSQAIAQVAEGLADEVALVATTGKASRELFTSADRQGNFYILGSMGCASSVALGVSLVQPERPIVVLDGDGASLMRLESLVSVGHYGPNRFTHIILDNGQHESTGGQPTLSSTVDFCEVALAVGYQTAARARDAASLAEALDRTHRERGPHLIHLALRPGSDPALGRPTLTPTDIRERFRRFLGVR